VNYGTSDAWVVRLDALGNKIWDIDLGGTGFDSLVSNGTTSDGGFILGASSSSAANGNKTSPNYGQADYWVIKLDSNGSKEWENTFGGNLTDSIIRTLQTSDGGYIVGGTSSSGVAGNKTSPGYGGDDFWVVKLDSAGNKVWENSFGGNSNDDLTTLQLTSDGGYILGGYSASGISGNKTSTNYGGLDYWIVKLDNDGNKMWEISFGGSADDDLYGVEPLAGGGYLLAGYSYSGISGNKTVANFGSSDFWVVKLSVPAPQLTITRSISQVNLSWPKVSGDFGLQQNDNLSTTNWNDVLITPGDDGTNKIVPMPAVLPRSFFRLRGQ
jgi:hypothetical protein